MTNHDINVEFPSKPCPNSFTETTQGTHAISNSALAEQAHLRNVSAEATRVGGIDPSLPSQHDEPQGKESLEDPFIGASMIKLSLCLHPLATRWRQRAL